MWVQRRAVPLRSGVPPRQSKTQRIAVSNNGGSTDLTVRGPGHVRVKAVGDEVEFYFGVGVLGSVQYNQTGSGSGVGGTLRSGESEIYELQKETVVSWVSAGLGGGFLVISKADSGRVGVP